jgi:hypothetical protein
MEKMWKVPSRNRNNGFIPIRELLGLRDKNFKLTVDTQKITQGRKQVPRWGNFSQIYTLQATPHSKKTR